MRRARRDERALIERIAQRDPLAAAQLVERYADEIHGFLVRRVARQDIEDRLHEVFARALRGASRFQGDSGIRSWLYGIARNVLREGRRDRLEIRSFVDLVDVAPGPQSLAIGAQLQQQLLSALEALPDEQAIVLELHRIDGLSHDRIGELLNISAATSRKRLERALRAIRARLRNAGPPNETYHQEIESWRLALQRRTLESESPS